MALLFRLQIYAIFINIRQKSSIFVSVFSCNSSKIKEAMCPLVVYLQSSFLPHIVGEVLHMVAGTECVEHIVGGNFRRLSVEEAWVGEEAEAHAVV